MKTYLTIAAILAASLTTTNLATAQEAGGSTPVGAGQFAAQDSVVMEVQKALARDEYYHGPIDGTLDLITQDAIAKYDSDHHLPVTYTIDQPLLQSLRAE